MPDTRWLAAAALAGLLTGCGGPRQGGQPRERERPRYVLSNIERGDYAGSGACSSCHAGVDAAWAGSPMHNMTRGAGTAAIRAPFDGRALHLADDSAVLVTKSSLRFMRLHTRAGERLFRVTKVIGGRYREDFAGVPVASFEGAAAGPERVLPVSFVFSDASLRYKGYSVLVKERPRLEPGPVWSETCIGCHNTLPRLSLLYDDLLGGHDVSYQGSVSDDRLPPERTFQLSVRDEHGLRRAIASEVEYIGAPRPEGSLEEVLRMAASRTRRALDERDLIEVGVGCESCHGGAAEHVRNPRVLPSFAVESPLLEANRAHAGPPPTRAELINQSCLRCHTVLFSKYPFTWEGKRLTDAEPGGSTINSGEARDFLLGGCARAMSCTTCHDPHRQDSKERLRELQTPAGNSVCTSCHQELASGKALRAHAHHPLGSAGSACLSCHMPKKNMGLGYELTAYHRIGSPTDTERVLGDRPLECALCHTDKSVETIVRTMERWWSKRYDRAALRTLYGSNLAENALRLALLGNKAHEQAAAIGALGEHGGASAVPLLAPHLAHEYPLVRYFTRRSLERLTGSEVPVDVGAPAGRVALEAERLLGEWTRQR